MSKEELLKKINSLHQLKYYIKKEKIEMIEKEELDVWKLYFNLTGIKHPHDLFNNIWSLNEKEKNQQIEKISNDQNYNNLYFANPFSLCHKDFWKYAAQVIIKRGYPIVEDVIPELFVWLQDINWPGSYDIYQFLCTIPKTSILKYFENTVNEAYNNHDEGWLYYLQQLMYQLNITEQDFKNKKLFEIINQKIKY